MDFFRDKKDDKKKQEDVFFNSKSNVDKPEGLWHEPNSPESMAVSGKNPNMDPNFFRDKESRANDEIVDGCSLVDDVYRKINVELPKHFPPFRPFDFRFITGLYKLNAVSKYMKKICNIKLDKIIRKKRKTLNEKSILNQNDKCFDIMMRSMALIVDAEFKVFEPETNKELAMMSIISCYESILYNIRTFLSTSSNYIEFYNNEDKLKENLNDVNLMVNGDKEPDMKKVEKFITYTNRIVGTLNATLGLIADQLPSQDDVHKDIIKRINLMKHEKTEE